MMLSAYLFFSICTVVLSFVKAQYLPDRPSLIIKELEHLYLDAASSGLISAITPCTNYVDSSTGLPGNGLGRQTAAEWIRTAFRKLLHFQSVRLSQVACKPNTLVCPSGR